MNNTFSISRFALLLRRQWIENRKMYLAGTMTLFGFICFVYILHIITGGVTPSALVNGSTEDIEKFYRFSRFDFRFLLLGLSGICYLSLLSGHCFSNLGKPAKAIQELTLPVSGTEKLSVALLFSSLFMIVSFAVVFMAADVLFISTMKSIYKDVPIPELRGSSFFEEYGFQYVFQLSDLTLVPYFSIISVLLTSAFCLGSVYFRRLTFAKTALTVTVFVISVLSIYSMIGEQLTKGLISVPDSDRYNDTYMSYASFLFIVAVGSLWISTYFRLKEREV